MGEREDMRAMLELMADALRQSNATNEKLGAMLAERQAAPETNPERMSLADMNARRLDEMRGAGIPDPPTEVVRGCESILLQSGAKRGATFDARIVRGIVCQLLNYKLPEGTDRHIGAGGLFPDGVDMYQPTALTGDGQRARTGRYDQWLYEFWKADLKLYVGHPLPPHTDPRLRTPRAAE